MHHLRKLTTHTHENGQIGLGVISALVGLGLSLIGLSFLGLSIFGFSFFGLNQMDQSSMGPLSSMKSVMTQSMKGVFAAEDQMSNQVSNFYRLLSSRVTANQSFEIAPPLATPSLTMDPSYKKLGKTLVQYHPPVSKKEYLVNPLGVVSPFATYSEQTSAKTSNQIEAHKNLADLNEINQFLSHQQSDYKFIENKIFLDNARNKLPAFKNEFKKAAAKNDLDWRLIASIAYQESVWDPNAVSPTGVKGMMMLTRITAKEMGVKDRVNAQESIQGGAAYFSKLLNRIPTEVQGPDRKLMALAAYNMGYGHLIAARELTERQGGDSTSWLEVKQRIPLLQQKKYYKESKYGYARGARQALHYVSQIQMHLHMLLMLTEKDSIAQGQVDESTIYNFNLARYGKSSE